MSIEKEIKEARRLIKLKNRSAYQLGLILTRWRETGEWRLLENKKGEVRYKTFASFIRGEIGFGGDQHAYRYIRVVKSFTKAETEKYGVSRLYIASKIPARAVAMKALRDGASKQDLERIYADFQFRKDTRPYRRISVTLDRELVNEMNERCDDSGETWDEFVAKSLRSRLSRSRPVLRRLAS